MRNTFVVLKKELRVYLTTVTAYAGTGAFAFIMGILFILKVNQFQAYTRRFLAQQEPQYLELLNFNDMIIAPMLQSGVSIFLFFVPFLTMRLFAEEKSGRTFELLMSLPLRSIDLVLGKFGALALIVSIMVTIPLIFPLILSMYGEGGGPEWAPIWSGTLVVLLVVLAFCALGMLFSALSESQIVAALLTFAALLVGVFLPMLAGRLDGDWRAVLEYLSPLTHLRHGLTGRLHIKNLIYLGSSIVLCLLLTHRVVESHRWR